MACSFCGKPKSQVRLIAGPEGIAICEECVTLFTDILNEPGHRSSSAQSRSPFQGRPEQCSAGVNRFISGGRALLDLGYVLIRRRTQTGGNKLARTKWRRMSGKKIPRKFQSKRS